jgi:hypothetical protein
MISVFRHTGQVMVLVGSIILGWSFWLNRSRFRGGRAAEAMIQAEAKLPGTWMA